MTPDVFDIFLITGQSNSSGASDDATDEETRRENAVAPEQGAAYCLDVDNKGMYGDYYDLSVGRKGFSPALAKRWNELTGRGVFVIQTAVAGSPIQKWNYGENRRADNGRNLLDNTIRAAKYVLSLGRGEHPRFAFGDVYYFWCQGETGQAHEWMGDRWKMPGVHILDTDTYYRKFLGYHWGLLSNIDVRAGAIMLVRTLPRVSSAESRRLGLLTDNNASKQAQYTAHAELGATVRILSRICDIARMETTPGPGAGYMKADNVHYRKKGYNAQGREMAENLYRWMYTEDSAPVGLEWLAPDGRTRMKDGDVLPVDARRGALTSAMVLPYWAKDPRVSFSVTENGDVCSVDRYGTVRFAPGTPPGTEAKVQVRAAFGDALTVTARCCEPAPAEETGKGVVMDFIWTFAGGNLAEYNEYNNLKPEGKAEAVPVGNGISATGSFLAERSLLISDRFDWSCEWSGSFPEETMLLGGGNCRLDTGVSENGGAAVRLVTAEGDVFTFSYPRAEREHSVLSYCAGTRTLTLSSGESAVSRRTENPFSARFLRVLCRTSGVAEEIKVRMYIEE